MTEAYFIRVYDLCGFDLGEMVEYEFHNFVCILGRGSVWTLPAMNSKTTNKLGWLPSSKA